MSDPLLPLPTLLSLLAKVNDAASALTNTSASGGEGQGKGEEHAARRKLQLEARRLTNALEEPNGEVWPRIYQANVSAVVEIMSDLGLWSKFEDGKTVALKQIVEETGADEIIIIRTLRHLVAAGILADIPGPGYALTHLGQPYLNPDHRAFNSFLFTEILPSILAMPRTLAAHAYKAPTKASGTPYKWANGEELWTYLGAHPERALNMVKGMRSLNAGNVSGDAYPWGEELGALGITDENEVAVVDIAGGQGHIMEEVRRRFPELKGRFVVQDLQSTFDAVQGGPPVGVEFIAYDIFTPQPIRNAHVYYYRHIFHDWNDEDCSAFLAQVVPCLRESKKKSKLLLVDLVLPDADVTMQEAIRDMSMFPIGGLERNERQWRELLKRNGLGIKKIWRGSEPEACVECELL